MKYETDTLPQAHRERIPRHSLIITVDGPTGTGKEALCRGIADHYGLTFLNTGVSLRALALRALEEQIIKIDDDRNIILQDDDKEALERFVLSLKKLPHFEHPKKADVSALCFMGTRNMLEDISEYDNQSHIEMISTAIAVMPRVREKLYDTWRNAQQSLGGVVVDGRKTGVDLFPDAQMKLYLVANPEVSGLYRLRKGYTATQSHITEEYYIKHRDAIESRGGLLEIPKDSLEINTTLYLQDAQGEQFLVSDVISKIDHTLEII